MINSALLLAAWLRTNACPNVYVRSIPDNYQLPLIRQTRLGGAPSSALPAPWLEEVNFQLDIYGSSAEIDAATTALSLALPDIVGVHSQGVVSGARITAVRDLPDTAYVPPRDRAVVSLTLNVHP